MVQIRQHLVSTAVAIKVTGGHKNTRKKVCIHETDNTKKGSGADNHARLQANGNSRQASWHWTVDDKEAVQSFTHDYQCWAAGSTKGNNEAIHIEMCVNADGDYVRTVQNTAALVAKILKEENLTINDVVQHNYYSGKNCPSKMRSKSTPIPWSSFLQIVKSIMQPPIPNNTVKDDDKMQFTNETLKAAVRDYLKQAVDKKLIDKSHLEKFDAGTMTSGDFEGLKIIIAQRNI
ncbi:N-acetylmuramoyl-L-alanine amidase [Lysinibacillus sp. OL1_EC]|uniref:peptidoglycan recognition protein family protein n=1 Tax=unclassified Lysinibacillus TaxID=2636778 RepID=UPI00103DA36D|nr:MULTISPECIES: N-acetylmuramoyl-L-alanine amidase [unclassified Lysinibacillus]MCM0627477.1 N-acetylmuramoyl-L-alanine amidase [Lysinibacillus sp. OL1_EC]TBV84316.1 XlyB [Lysinibacillus sp. OL1]